MRMVTGKELDKAILKSQGRTWDGMPISELKDGYLIRVAMLAFYKEPEKWVTGAYVKIGHFAQSDADLKYQDEVYGSLIEQVDKTVDLVYAKYMKALISYEGIQRIEQFMFHQDAFREILLNAIVHKDYSSCNPIQISVYEDKIYIWNDGKCRKIWIQRINCLQNILQNPTILSWQMYFS